MLLLKCNGIKKSFADVEVLKSIDLELQVGERIGLVGPNGAGKTTLANILFNSIQPDGGNIIFYKPELKIGYLLQSKKYISNQKLEVWDSDGSDKQFLANTSNLGLKKVQQWEDERLEGLSGGERTKLALAEIWTDKPDLLILDEPTNHLDLEGVEWLTQKICSYNGAILIISHDRHFLDQTVNRIAEIEAGNINNYAGNYTFYREEKARRYESQMHEYVENKKRQDKIEGEISRLKNWSAKAHKDAGKVGKMADMRKGVKEFYRSKAKKMDTAVKSRIKRLEKMREEGIERPKDEPNVSFTIDDASRHGRRILEVDKVKKTFGDRVLFQDSSFNVLRGEKVGLLGSNGCGKTTLIKILLGETEADEGKVWVSPSAKLGYLSQELEDMNLRETVLEMLELDGRIYIEYARHMLANLGFDEEMVDRRVEQFSMGERLKLKLAKLILNKADFLILDEPTNHLDLYSREDLEETLSGYDGTMLIVSHDSYMLERLADWILVFKDGRLTKYQGSFKEFKDNNVKDIKEAKSKEKLKEELMLLENEITYILSTLNQYNSADSKYQELDRDFKKALNRKKELKHELDK